MMAELSMHIMDIVENGLAAGAQHVDVFIRIDTVGNRLAISVVDNGEGMDTDTIQKALNPFYSTKKGKGWGLGIPLFKQTAEQCGGKFEITSEKNIFTRVDAEMELDNIDRPPLGNLTDTIISIIVGHPEADLFFSIANDGKKYDFDTRIVRDVLGNISLSTPEVLKALEEDLVSGIEDAGLKE